MNMDRIWANRLIGGTQVWDDVPEKRRKGVIEELTARVVSGELSEAEMNGIIGWNEDIDIAPEYLYEHGKIIN